MKKGPSAPFRLFLLLVVGIVREIISQQSPPAPHEILVDVIGKGFKGATSFLQLREEEKNNCATYDIASNVLLSMDWLSYVAAIVLDKGHQGKSPAVPPSDH